MLRASALIIGLEINKIFLNTALQLKVEELTDYSMITHFPIITKATASKQSLGVYEKTFTKFMFKVY
jgi:hypothetical protein